MSFGGGSLWAGGGLWGVVVPGPSAPNSTTIQFFDETGLNPLPPGVLVAITDQNGKAIGTAYTTLGGYFSVPVATAVTYTATFIGTQAPQQSQTFVGAATLDPTEQYTLVSVQNYRSPVISAAGYADLASELQPNGWYAQSEIVPGGGLHAVMRGLLGGQALIDGELQQIQAAMRLPSCTGPAIDSWARDFFNSPGPSGTAVLPRYPQESDASYMGRIVSMLSLPKCTIQAIQNVTVAFYTAIAIQTGEDLTQNLTFDSLGGFDNIGGYDVAPGFTPYIPAINVWDRQSRPHLADLYNINPDNDDGSFVIQIGSGFANTDAWFLDRSSLDYSSFLINPNQYTLSTTAPDPRLAALVNFVKAGGTQPLYLTALTT